MSIHDEIPAQLLPTGNHTFLLPNATVAEIVRHVTLLPTNNSNPPPWVIGDFMWQGQPVPLISLDRILDPRIILPPERKCVIVKTLDPKHPRPCYGLLISGLPQFVNVQKHGLLLDATQDTPPTGIRMAVLVAGKTALIPDLDIIDSLLEH